MLREIAQTETFTVLLMVCLFLVTIAKLLSTKRFHDFIEIMTHFRYVRLYSREQRFFDVFDALLFGNLIIGLSVFSYLCHQLLNSSQNINLTFLFKIGLTIAIALLIKVLLERLIASYLNIESLMGNYLFHKISYKNFIGLLLLPINVILVYGITTNKIILIIAASLLLLINCIGILLFLRANQKLILSHIFYFILYLCALEISPYVVLYKFFTDTITML